MQLIQQLLQAIKRTPNDPGLHYELGGLYLENKDIESALLSYQEGVETSPQPPSDFIATWQYRDCC